MMRGEKFQKVAIKEALLKPIDGCDPYQPRQMLRQSHTNRPIARLCTPTKTFFKV